ncbi:hypothetical protein Nepgr_019863 [Nepenthes gracilis]|uniref:TFIIS N-terminal domain-containing protein n=1 Tax=Nepenthes gracilis TaxID=150966 RepID=A0AAD3SW25_NEPGR|nr:hypothetical protein Nepgr_019863 [Nepenthes gracilis]
MTLEDFFTLTEMKDGLTSPARVEELVAVMQKEKDCVLKNVSDATRQLSAVASAIAATENRDCLDLFIKLDGLWFIGRWLKDAQTFATDSTDCFVEESITALLQAFEKLQVDKEKLISSGIWVTVNNLLSHKNMNVQQSARALVDSWKQAKDGDEVHTDVEIACDGGMDARDKPAGGSVSSAVDAHQVTQNEEFCTSQIAGHDIIVSGHTVEHQSTGVKIEKIQFPNNQVSSRIHFDGADVEDACSDIPGSDGMLVSEVHCLEGTLEGQSSQDLKPDSGEGNSDAVKSECSVDGFGQVDKNEDFASKSGKMETSSASAMSKPGDLSVAETEAAPESVLKFAGETNSVDDNKSSAKTTSLGGLGDTHASVSKSSSVMDDYGVLQNCTTTSDHKFSVRGDECCSSSSQDSPGSGYMLEKCEDVEATSARMGDGETNNEIKGYTKRDQEHFSNISDFAKSTRGSSDAILKVSSMDLEFGTVDALEIARLVANEVERQVGDYDEHSGSSSSAGLFRGSIPQLDNVDSINEKQDQHTERQPNELPCVENPSAEACPKGDLHLTSTVDLDAGQEICVQDMESSQVTEAARELEINSEKSMCEFDLNQDVCFGDNQVAAKLMTSPLAVSSSAARALAAAGMPVAPLQFEGSLGWKGSATTSAFRPASPRRNSDGDRSASVGGTSSSSRQRQDSLVIDLNVADGEDEMFADPITREQNPKALGLPSGGSSFELSPRKTERLFDLNQMSVDVDVAPQNGFHHASPTSSTSSMKPSMRNFDLNDRPSWNYADPLELQPFLGETSLHKLNSYEGLPDDSVVSIMGARVSRNTFPPPSSLFLPNGRASEPLMDANLARAGHLWGSYTTLPSAHSSMYGHNGLSMRPSMSFPAAMYGTLSCSIPYMVDSRGVAVVPQIIGSASTVPPSCSQSSFIISSNGAGPSHLNINPNSGYAHDKVNRDLHRVSGQLFIPGSARQFPLGEQLRDNLQPSCSGVSGKRKEPDGGWEPFLMNYKHHKPPHL